MLESWNWVHTNICVFKPTQKISLALNAATGSFSLKTAA
jgi:hypothetical protein